MSIKLFACGDIVNQTNNPNIVDKKLKAIIQDSDLSICNFEAPIEVANMKPINKVGPHLYQKKNSIQHLKKIGFDILSLANNHIYDYGEKALKTTLAEIKNKNLAYIGAGKNFVEAYQTKVVEIKNIRIALLSACESEFGCLMEDQKRGGYAWINHYLIEDNIRELKQKTDLVVFIAHAGVEEIALPLPEWRERYKRLCSVGVDIVIGHHPHVPQGFEKYCGSMIFYSLGNFYFDSESFKNSTDDSYSLIFRLTKRGLKNFEIIYHKKIALQTKMVKEADTNFSIKNLNAKLSNKYIETITKVIKDLFYTRYLPYYRDSLKELVSNFPEKGSTRKKLKYTLKSIFLKNKDQIISKKMLLLLHNIRIESHRYTVQRALSLLFEKK